MQEGLGPGHIVLDGDPAPLPKGAHSQFSAHICCGQMAGWIKMPLGIEVGLGPGDFVLHGHPDPYAKKGAEPPTFGPCLLWPNDCMDQDVTCYGGRPRPRRHCGRCGPSSPLSKKEAEPPPQFYAHVYCGQTAGWIKMTLGMEVGLRPGHIVLDGDPAPLTKKGAEPQIFGPFLLWPKGWMHQDATWYGGRPQPRRLCVR